MATCHRSSARLIALFTLIVFIGLLPAACEPAPERRQIAYSSRTDRSADWNIYLMNADGSHIRKLTASSENDLCPVWLPDGRHIAFIRDSGNDQGIMVLDVNDGSTIPLPAFSQIKDIDRIAWSPNGLQVAVSAVWHGPPGIIVADADGSNPIRLGPALGLDTGIETDPAWSPDGQHIVFVSNRGIYGTSRAWESYNVYVMDAGGSETHQLTSDAGIHRSPTWSPDGTHIAFAASRCPAERCGEFASRWDDWNIYVMDADGQHAAQLTTGPNHDYGPSWSPSGEQIAFISGPDDFTCLGPQCKGFDIYVMGSDGSNTTRLTTSGDSRCPSWRP